MADEKDSKPKGAEMDLEAAKAAARARAMRARAAIAARPVTPLAAEPGTLRPVESQTPPAQNVYVVDDEELSRQMAKDRIYVWPYLVRAEFIATLATLVILMLWSLVVDAPLEEPANPSKTPNPSKAPWYFLGLQEMLVYFDPWLAGVIFPGFIIAGLMVLPYVDVNPKGNGYYCYEERKFAINTFLFGYVVLWIALIIIGVFLRGPGWNFFLPWEPWDSHKVVALTNVNLVDLGFIKSISPHIKVMGVDLVGALFLAAFYATGVAYWQLYKDKSPTLQKMGAVRYGVTAFFFLTMMLLPLKMVMRWTLHVKYIWVTPWFNV